MARVNREEEEREEEIALLALPELKLAGRTSRETLLSRLELRPPIFPICSPLVLFFARQRELHRLLSIGRSLPSNHLSVRISFPNQLHFARIQVRASFAGTNEAPHWNDIFSPDAVLIKLISSYHHTITKISLTSNQM